jgi:hypothetical protein
VDVRQLLSSKMKITVDPVNLESFSQKHIGFYMKYSSFALRALERSSFQKFLCWMLNRENIEEQMIRGVYVKVFPLRRQNGKGLAGNCDITKGRICIYPKTIKFCRVFTQKWGKRTLLVYAGNRARAALIHELLHLKYTTDEEKVRELAKEYFFAFTQNQSANNSHALRIYAMIFKAKTAKKPAQVSLGKINRIAPELGIPKAVQVSSNTC